MAGYKPRWFTRDWLVYLAQCVTPTTHGVGSVSGLDVECGLGNIKAVAVRLISRADKRI